MLRRVALLLVVLTCGCSGRQGSYVVGEAGLLSDAAPEAGDAAYAVDAVDAADAADGGALDASADAPTDAASADAGPDMACIDFCATALSLHCANDNMSDCLYACDDTLKQFPACAGQYNAENTCAAAEPLSHWYCDSDGFAALDHNYCATETSAYNTCRQAH